MRVVGGNGAKSFYCRLNVLEEFGTFSPMSDVAVGTEGLEEALNGGVEKREREGGWGAGSGEREAGRICGEGVESVLIVVEESEALVVGERDVRVEEERGDVVKTGADAEALEVYEVGGGVVPEDVLGLTVAVDELARVFAETFDEGG